MERITSVKLAKERLFAELQRYIARIRELVGKDVSSIEQGIAILRDLRKESYEDLNQIQHEGLILRAVQWFESSLSEGTVPDWYWNPRQTGDSTEPDLRGIRDGVVVVSVEATTSEEPKGSIDKRMRETLAKLNDMSGKRYYFVRTEQMAKRAKTKILNNDYQIKVVKL